MSVQILIPYPNQILYTNRQDATGRSTGLPSIDGRTPFGEQPSIEGFILAGGFHLEVRRSLAGDPLNNSWKKLHLGLIPNGVRTVSRRRSAGDCWVSDESPSRLRKMAGLPSPSQGSSTPGNSQRPTGVRVNPNELGRKHNN